MTSPETAVRSFPRTFKLMNWRLMALLLVLGAVPTLILWRAGTWAGLWVLGGLVAFAALAVFSVQLLVELFGARFVSALHLDGFVARRLLSRTFIPWDDVERVRASSVVVYVQGETVRQEIFDVDYGARAPVRITAEEGGSETAEFIVQHAGLEWAGDIAEKP